MQQDDHCDTSPSLPASREKRGHSGWWLFALFCFYVFTYTAHPHVNAIVAEDGKMWGGPEVPGSSWEILYQGVEKKKKKQETFSFLVVQGRSRRVKTSDSIPLLCR